MSLGLTGCKECRFEPLSSLIVLLNWELEECCVDGCGGGCAGMCGCHALAPWKHKALVGLGKIVFMKVTPQCMTAAVASGAFHWKVIYFSRLFLLWKLVVSRHWLLKLWPHSSGSSKLWFCLLRLFRYIQGITLCILLFTENNTNNIFIILYSLLFSVFSILEC